MSWLYPYTPKDSSNEFSDFDRSYEKEHMWDLIKSWWPVNWSYIDKTNIGGIMSALVYKTLMHDTKELLPQVKWVVWGVAFKINNIMWNFKKWSKIKQLRKEEVDSIHV